jgi:hypothetical protein
MRRSPRSRALQRILAEVGADFHRLANVVETAWRDPDPVVVDLFGQNDPPLAEWQRLAPEFLTHAHDPRVVWGSRERDFLHNMKKGADAAVARPDEVVEHRRTKESGMTMSKAEREDLQRLVRQREKVLKSAAKQRSADLIADFENQMGQQYAFDQDEVWREAVERAKPLVDKAQLQIERRCAELGIPNEFAPSISLRWSGRGYGNVLDKRRDELRRMAETQIRAIEAKAITQIEMSCLKAQEQIALAGIGSGAARQFIDNLPSVEKLMPALTFTEVSGDEPIAAQLISSNALRQRRYRERKALQAVTQMALSSADFNPNEED